MHALIVPAISAAIMCGVGAIIKDPTASVFLYGIGAGFIFAALGPFLTKWWSRDVGERMFCDTVRVITKMNELFLNNPDESLNIFADWWQNLNYRVTKFASKPTRDEGRALMRNAKSILKHSEKFLNSKQRKSSDRILEIADEVLEKS